MRSKEIYLPETREGVRALTHEAEFYGITPLHQRLTLVEDLDCSSCGSVLFYGCLNPPSKWTFPRAGCSIGWWKLAQFAISTDRHTSSRDADQPTRQRLVFAEQRIAAFVARSEDLARRSEDSTDRHRYYYCYYYNYY